MGCPPGATEVEYLVVAVEVEVEDQGLAVEVVLVVF
jgi:hypothetical protein